MANPFLFCQPGACTDEYTRAERAILLKACGRRLGLMDAIAGCLPERRRADRVVHDLLELVEPLVYEMACGYEDCNDGARLSSDPVYRLLLARDPIEGERLASQPTRLALRPRSTAAH